MSAGSRRAATAALGLPLFLVTGCLFTTRKLPVPRPPAVVQTASGEELVAKINQRWGAIDSVVVNVEIQLSKMNAKAGEERDYTTFPGIILLRKPEMLRVYGRVPVIGSPMFNMVSDGQNFTMYVPSKNIAYQGPDTLTHKSPNTMENIRPGFFLNAIVVRGITPEDEYTVIADTDTVEDPTKKHLLLIPEYILSVMQGKPGSHQLRLLRVLHIHRDDLLPYEQDLYDDQNNLETQVLYGRYADYGDNRYPSTITIKRPLEDFQIVMTVEKVVTSMNLKDDQFQVQIPEGTKIQTVQ